MPIKKEEVKLETSLICRLCNQSGPFERLISPLGCYYRLCQNCQLIFIEDQYLPDPEIEKARYLTHQNSPTEPGYVKFLSRAITPSLPFLKKGMRGLDFGCGPGPTLGTLLKRDGLICDNYDPFFFPELKEKEYDFIFATEALEHFHNPGIEFDRIHGLMKQGGIFTLMTEFWNEKEPFEDWYYAKDFTHVCFFHLDTIQHICDSLGFELLFSDNSRVAVLRKSSHQKSPVQLG